MKIIVDKVGNLIHYDFQGKANRNAEMQSLENKVSLILLAAQEVGTIDADAQTKVYEYNKRYEILKKEKEKWG